MSNPTVFLTGATGYVGASFLQSLLSSPTNPPRSVTCLTRSESKVRSLEALGTAQTQVRAVVGSFDDTELLTRLVAENEVTVETADSDRLGMMQALLEGMRVRKERGQETVFIHTSGTGTLVDDARGEYAGDVIYTDAHPTDGQKHINELPSSAFHREVDLAIVKADQAGWCKSFIILPGTIWGEGKGPVYDSGVGHKWSSQIPGLAGASLDRGRAGMVGKGLNIWVWVHIDDVASHFSTVYHSALSGKAPHGPDGYFFCTAGEYTLLRASQEIGKTMLANDWTESAAPESFTDDECAKYFGAMEEIGGSRYYGGTNSRGRSVQAGHLGWAPEHTAEEEFYAYCRKETERIGRKGKPFV